MRGPLRISGTSLDLRASWHVTTDKLGWTTVALLSDPHGPDASIPKILRDCAEHNCDPIETALALRDRMRRHGRARGVGLAIARVGLYGRVMELVNVSLPAVVSWDPIEGMSPYEPTFLDLHALGPEIGTEMIRIRTGSAVLFASEGVLSHDAGWGELRGLTRALGLDPLGGMLADAPPLELTRILQSSWARGEGPAGLVVMGLPGAVEQVA